MSGTVAAVLVASCLCAAAGQALLKLGATGRLGPIEFANAHVFFGLLGYAVGLVLWMFSLSRLPLFVAYPFTLLTTLCVGVFSLVFLGERPGSLAYPGWVLVVIGLVLISAASRPS